MNQGRGAVFPEEKVALRSVTETLGTAWLCSSMQALRWRGFRRRRKRLKLGSASVFMSGGEGFT
jgi:hypothetical protein